MIKRDESWEKSTTTVHEMGYIFTVAKVNAEAMHLLKIESDRVNGISLKEGLQLSS